MVGGIVYAVNKWQEKIQVTTQGTGCEKNDFLEVTLENNEHSRRIMAGDQIWWQNSWAFWTPQSGDIHDEIRIPRAGLAVRVPID